MNKQVTLEIVHIIKNSSEFLNLINLQIRITKLNTNKSSTSNTSIKNSINNQEEDEILLSSSLLLEEEIIEKEYL